MSEEISGDENSSGTLHGEPIFQVEKINRNLSAEKKKALEVDRIMKMDIKYRPYEEELKEGEKRRRGKKAVILKDYSKESKEKILLLTNQAKLNGLTKHQRGKMKN